MLIEQSLKAKEIEKKKNCSILERNGSFRIAWEIGDYGWNKSKIFSKFDELIKFAETI